MNDLDRLLDGLRDLYEPEPITISSAMWERWRRTNDSGVERKSWSDLIWIGSDDVEPTIEELCPLCGRARSKCLE